MWTCPKCGTKVDPSLDVCWRCGTSAEGVEDPTFVSADEAGPIEDPPVAPTLESIQSPPAGELAGTPASELVSCYQAYSLMEAQFLANELNAQGIPAISDTHDMQDALGTWEGNPRVWVRAEDLPRARVWLEAYDREHKGRRHVGE